VLHTTVFLIPSDDLGWNDVRATLQVMPEIEVVGETPTAREAIEAIISRRPDVVISTMIMEGTSTLPLLATLRREYCLASRIVVFASCFDQYQLAALADIDVAGYLLWRDLSCKTLRNCLAIVLGGDINVSSHAAVRAFVEAKRQSPFPQVQMARLTERERTILQRLADGLTQEQIAKSECISPRTVKRVVASLELKLDASCLFVLATRAMRLGLLDGAALSADEENNRRQWSR